MPQPDRLLFVDVETTGLFHSDRIVSFGAILIEAAALARSEFQGQAAHLIFDPGKASHPKAEAVHGWSDWALRHQDPFEDHAADIRALFDRADLVVGHNVGFDWRFIRGEFDRAGAPLEEKPLFCTMQGWRGTVGGRAGLKDVIASMGLRRSGETHGAFEDAWLAMRAFLWLHDLPQPKESDAPLLLPTNRREVPPLPENGAPRRRSRKGSEATVIVPEFGARQHLLMTAEPIATFLMWIARADGLAPEEIPVIGEMVRAEAERRSIHISDDGLRDVTATLLELEPTAEQLDRAADALVAGGDLERLGAWIKQTTYADGRGTDEERDAIARVTEAFQKARLAS